MDSKKEMKLAQLMSGKIGCDVFDDILFIGPPSPMDRLNGLLLYSSVYRDAELMGVFDDVQVKEMLIDAHLWSEAEETELNSVGLKSEALKVEMYTRHTSFQSARLEQARHLLQKLEKNADALFARRHYYDSYTCNGLATSAYIEYVIINNVFTYRGEHIDVYERGDTYVRELLNECCKHKLIDKEIRELSKYDGWRIIWVAGKAEGKVFGIPSVEMTDEQRSIINWSRFYDNVNEHPEKPDKVVIDDDDLLDGWLIIENKKSEDKTKGGDNKLSKKMGGAQEVFIPAETIEDARRIDALNEGEAAILKRQRLNMLHKQGVVQEQHMPDSKIAIVSKAHQMMKDRIKQTRR